MTHRETLRVERSVKGWELYHEKRHLDVCGWVGFLGQRFIRGDLIFFEIPNKWFVFMLLSVKTDMNKIQKKFFLFCIFFPFCFTILKLYVCFQYSIFIKIFHISWLHNTSLSVAGKKTLIHKSVEINREIPSLVYLIVLAFSLCGLRRLVVFFIPFFFS